MMLLRSFSSHPRQPLQDDAPIVVGLVNNAADSALRGTEEQFRDLLSVAAQGRAVCLRLFSLPELPRGDAARAHVADHYEDINDLWEADLDGLIVTGREPRTPALAEEPYWPTLSRLIDWAENHTVSTIWSCLAAHAAVLHMDGIERHLLPQKLSGVFDCAKHADHALLADLPSRWRVPHSRCNGLSEQALVANNYLILSGLAGSDIDIFVKRRKSLFVFLQGHPEYQPEALLREYCRDIRRFLAGEQSRYPEMPRDYLDARATAAFIELHELALQGAGTALLSRVQTLAATIHVAPVWREPAIRIYANWLSLLAEQRSASRVESGAAPLGQHASWDRGGDVNEHGGPEPDGHELLRHLLPRD